MDLKDSHSHSATSSTPSGSFDSRIRDVTGGLPAYDQPPSYTRSEPPLEPWIKAARNAERYNDMCPANLSAFMPNQHDYWAQYYQSLVINLRKFGLSRDPQRNKSSAYMSMLSSLLMPLMSLDTPLTPLDALLLCFPAELVFTALHLYAHEESKHKSYLVNALRSRFSINEELKDQILRYGSCRPPWGLLNTQQRNYNALQTKWTLDYLPEDIRSAMTGLDIIPFNEYQALAKALFIITCRDAFSMDALSQIEVASQSQTDARRLRAEDMTMGQLFEGVFSDLADIFSVRATRIYRDVVNAD